MVKTVQQIDNIDLYKKVLDLQNDIFDLVEQNNSLKKEIESLKKRLEVKESLVYEEGLYWAQKPEGTKDGPYCTKCWDVDQKLVRLREGPKGYYLCLNCNSHFRTKDYKAPGPVRIR